MPKKKVLIADYENWDSLIEIPYLFAKAGCEVDVYSPAGSQLSKSRHRGRHLAAPAGRSAYASGLKRCAEEGSYDWVVLGDDMTGRIVAEAADSDTLLFALAPMKDFAQRAIIGSKAELSLACSRAGIPTPEYAIYMEDFDMRELAEKVAFPLLAKVDQSAGGSGVFLCRDQSDADEILSKLPAEKKKDLVFQRYVRGDNVSVEAIYKDGGLVAYAYSIVTKTLAGEFGVSSERRYVEHPEIEERLGEIGRAFGLHGFASMTFMRDAREHYLVEADLRPQAWYVLGAFAGADFVQGIREFFSAAPALVRPKLPGGKKEIVLQVFYRDIRWCLEEGDYRGLLKWLYNADGRWRTLPWHEPRILGSIFFRGVRYSIRKVFRRKSPAAIALLPVNL